MSENTKGITIATEEGNININAETFKEYMNEAFDHLNTIEEAQGFFKEVVETVAENTGAKKALISKYFKAKFAAKLKEQSELAAIFEQLEEAVA